MEKNFWSEENRIMNYGNLFRADLQNKLVKMSNQIVTSEDIPDLCYNYDYFIGQPDKAIQFISDYAEEFVKSLDRYRNSVGKMFTNVQNPMRMASLMALYAAKDIIAASEYMKERGDNKFALNNHNLDKILKDINGPDKQQTPRLVEKTLITKEDLTQVCLEYALNALLNVYKNNGDISLRKALTEMSRPVLTEQVVKSMIKNSYDEIAAVAANTPDVCTKDLLLFAEDIVYNVSQDMLKDEYGLDKEDKTLNREFLLKFHESVEKNQIHPKINFHPERKTDEKTMVNARTFKKEPVRENAREK